VGREEGARMEANGLGLTSKEELHVAVLPKRGAAYIIACSAQLIRFADINSGTKSRYKAAKSGPEANLVYTRSRGFLFEMFMTSHSPKTIVPENPGIFHLPSKGNGIIHGLSNTQLSCSASASPSCSSSHELLRAA
jgi:hypothetical protein